MFRDVVSQSMQELSQVPQQSSGVWGGPWEGAEGFLFPPRWVERGGQRAAGSRAVGSWLHWSYWGAGVGFGTQPLKRDVGFEPRRLEGLSRSCHNACAGEL